MRAGRRIQAPAQPATKRSRGESNARFHSIVRPRIRQVSETVAENRAQPALQGSASDTPII